MVLLVLAARQLHVVATNLTTNERANSSLKTTTDNSGLVSTLEMPPAGASYSYLHARGHDGVHPWNRGLQENCASFWY